MYTTKKLPVTIREKKVSEKLTIGIVGGGRGGAAILDLFGNSSLCSVLFIADVNPRAEAFEAARDAGIETSTHIRAIIEKLSVDLIIEATGVQKVFDEVKSYIKENTILLSSSVALLLFNILDENRKTIFKDVRGNISSVRENIVLETEKVRGSLAEITDISLNMKILSFNAGVEAARSQGNSGGFAVIAKEFGAISNRTRKLVDDVNLVTDSIAGLTESIDEYLEKFE